MTRRIVVTPAPLPPPFRAATRLSRLVADDAGLHWTSARGRTRSWERGPDGPATAVVVSGARAGGAAGLPGGPLLVVGDAAERPLLVVPVADWSAERLAPGRGDPLRGTALRPLVEALGLAVRPVGDGDVLRAATAAPMARARPRWTAAHQVGAAVGALALASGVALGIARGESTAWAAVGLVGFVVLLIAGAGHLAVGLFLERRTGGGWAAELCPDASRRRLLVARRGEGTEVGVREGDGVERWLPVGDSAGTVEAVHTSPTMVELLDPGGTVLQSLQAARWLPDRNARQELERLCAVACLPLRAIDGRNRVADLGSDLPTASATWPRLLPRPDLLLWIGGAFAAFNGGALLWGADGAVQHWLGAGYLVVAAVSVLLWLGVRRS